MKSGRSGGRFWKPLAGILPRWPRMRWPDNGDPGTKLSPAPGKSPNRAPDQVKSITATKEPFGRASFSPIRRARYLARQDAFEVALVHDGSIIAAALEERFTRKKHDERFPENAVRRCLDAPVDQSFQNFLPQSFELRHLKPASRLLHESFS